MLGEQMGSMRPEYQGLEVLQYLALQVVSKPMVRRLVAADIVRWRELSREEQGRVLHVNVRRVSAVCPWAADKDRVRDALAALERPT